MSQQLRTASTNDSIRTTPGLNDEFNEKSNSSAGGGRLDGALDDFDQGRRGKQRRRKSNGSRSNSNADLQHGQVKPANSFELAIPGAKGHLTRPFQSLSQVLEPAGAAPKSIDFGPFPSTAVSTVMKQRRVPMPNPRMENGGMKRRDNRVEMTKPKQERQKPREAEEDDLLIPEGKEMLPTWEDGESNPFVNFANKMKKYADEVRRDEDPPEANARDSKKHLQQKGRNGPGPQTGGGPGRNRQGERIPDGEAGRQRRGFDRVDGEADNDQFRSDRRYSPRDNWQPGNQQQRNGGRGRGNFETMNGGKRFKGNEEEEASPKRPLISNGGVFL
jgi:hypothetical protein